MASQLQDFDCVKERGALGQRHGHQLESDSISKSFESTAPQQEGTCRLTLGMSVRKGLFSAFPRLRNYIKLYLKKKTLLFLQPIRLEHWRDQDADKEPTWKRREGLLSTRRDGPGAGRSGAGGYEPRVQPRGQANRKPETGK